MDHAGHPGSDCPTTDRGKHQGAEDAAVMRPIEDLGRDRTEHRGHAVAKRTLSDHHHPQQHRARVGLEREQGEIGQHETDAADAPDNLAANTIRQLPERDLTRHAGKTHRAQRECGVMGGKAGLDQVFGLMDLHRVPHEKRTEKSERQPPETRGTHRASQGPFDRGPGRIDNIAGTGRATCSTRHTLVAIGKQPEILGAPTQQKHQWREQQRRKDAQRQTRCPPARLLDDPLQQGQQDDRADTDAGKRNAQREAPPAHEPGRQKQRLTRIAQAHAACRHQHTKGCVEMPGLAGQRGQQQAGCGRDDADQRDDHRAA